MIEQSIDRLIQAVDNLRIATENLAQELRATRNQPEPAAAAPLISALPVSSRPSSTVVLEELSRVPFPDHWLEELARQRYRGVEDGPPEVPQYVRDICTDRLSGKAPGPIARAEIAYRAGFWAKVSLTTHTEHRPREATKGLRNNHWVVLRSTFGAPFRTTSRREIDLICQSNHKDFVCEAFDSLTEVEVFCLGALENVPPLQTCSGRS